MQSRLWILALVLWIDVRVVPAVQAASATGEVSLGGGYDTNPFLQVAATPASPNYEASAGAFLRAAPGIDGTVAGDGYRFDLRYDAELRGFAGWLMALQQASLGVVLPELGTLPVRLRVGASATRYDDATLADDVTLPPGTYTAAGAELEVVAPVGPGWKLAASYRFDYRRFDSAEQLGIDYDLAHAPELHLFHRSSPRLEFGASAEYLALRSRFAGQPAGALDRMRAGAEALFRIAGSVAINVAGWAGGQTLEGFGWGVQAGGSAGIDVSIDSCIAVVLRYQALASAGQDPAFDYSRHLLMVGVQARARLPRQTSVSPPPAAVPGELAPFLEGRRVRFRVRASDASEVRVVGSWNGWRSGGPEARLARTAEDGLWEAWVDVGQGRHRYRFLVNGRAVRPPDAPRYLKDDFGGEDGYLEIP